MLLCLARYSNSEPINKRNPLPYAVRTSRQWSSINGCPLDVTQTNIPLPADDALDSQDDQFEIEGESHPYEVKSTCYQY